jgi:hypothetical protein
VEKMKALLQAEASACMGGLANVPECGRHFPFQPLCSKIFNVGSSFFGSLVTHVYHEKNFIESTIFLIISIEINSINESKLFCE